MKPVFFTGIKGELLVVNRDLITFAEEDLTKRYADYGATTIVHGIGYSLFVRESLNDVYNILKYNKGD